MTSQQIAAIQAALEHAEATVTEAQFHGVYPPHSLGALDLATCLEKIVAAYNALAEVIMETHK